MTTKSRKLLFFKIAVSSLVLFAPVFLFAQQDPQFTQFMFNGTFYNPAQVGKESGYMFSALHRTQWQNYTTSSGTGGAPVTQVMTAQGRLDGKNIGLGLVLVNDRIGASNTMEINFQTSYHKKIKRSTISFGGYAGLFSSSLDYGDFIVINPEPNLPLEGKESQITLDFGAGFLYDRGNMYLGLSAKHINQPSFNFGDGSYANQLKNHSYLLFGYRVRPIGQFRIEPAFLVKNVGLNNFSYNLSVMGTYQNRMNAGFAYRGEESVSLILGYSILKDNSLKLGYAFDLVVSGLDAKSPTSHEFILRYTLFDKVEEIDRKIQRSPRFRF